MSAELSVTPVRVTDRAVESFVIELTCPFCGDWFELRDIESVTVNIRRANLTCPPCEATFRLTVTLVRTYRP